MVGGVVAGEVARNAKWPGDADGGNPSRWVDSGLESSRPGQFIPIATDSPRAGPIECKRALKRDVFTQPSNSSNHAKIPWNTD